MFPHTGTQAGLKLRLNNYAGRSEQMPGQLERRAAPLGPLCANSGRARSMRKFLPGSFFYLASSLPLLASGSVRRRAEPIAVCDGVFTAGHSGVFSRNLSICSCIIAIRCCSGRKTARLLSAKIETPANHMTEERAGSYRVTIVFKNSTAATTANAASPRDQRTWPDSGVTTGHMNSGGSSSCWRTGICR